MTRVGEILHNSSQGSTCKIKSLIHPASSNALGYFLVSSLNELPRKKKSFHLKRVQIDVSIDFETMTSFRVACLHA